MKNEFVVIGLMSGTSLDGVDIALCKFTRSTDRWNYTVEKADTVPYSVEWKQKLVAAETSRGIDLMLLHKQYGTYLGELVSEFMKDQTIMADFISSHGHTIFHQPDKKLTFQLGDGAYIAATSGIKTISDFRNLDVALGGQGAPLVPIGDELLFNEFDQCLNLGGFANISYNDAGTRKAFDICPVNIVINHLTLKYFKADFDKNGSIGKSGEINLPLLDKLNNLDFYKEQPPKSLGKEWVLEYMLPTIDSIDIPTENKIRTVYENVAIQLSKVINSIPGDKILITGGGAYNLFLLELLRQKTNKQIILPDKLVIEFKEALIFAFLGVLRFLNVPNCLAAVTGASKNNCGGIIHYI